MGDYSEFLSSPGRKEGSRGSNVRGRGGRRGEGRGRGFQRGNPPRGNHMRGGPVHIPPHPHQMNPRNIVSYGDDWTDPFSASTSFRPSLYEPPPYRQRGSFRGSGPPRFFRGNPNGPRGRGGPGQNQRKIPGTSNLMYGEGKFNCKNCYMGFYNQSHFEEHNDYHVKCTEEDCDFEGISKIVAKHIMDKHGEGSGMVKKGGWSKERDSKWVEQRAAHFPSSANIQQKEEDHNSRIQRGQLITHGIGKQRHEKRVLDWAKDEEGEQPSEKMKKLLEEAETTNNEFQVGREHALNRKSLLENLLEPDIRRERNRLLQCIFYIVDHQFFEEPEQTEEPEPGQSSMEETAKSGQVDETTQNCD